MGRVRGMMPSAYSAYMKKMVDGGLEDELPPAADTLKKWRSIYLCYFNSDKSTSQGRRMAKKYCVKNPRPCEISKVLKELGINHILEHVSNQEFVLTFIGQETSSRFPFSRPHQVQTPQRPWPPL